MKNNLQALLLKIMKERRKDRFAAFLPDMAAAMEPLVEEALRDNFDRVLKRVNQKALADENDAAAAQPEAQS